MTIDYCEGRVLDIRGRPSEILQAANQGRFTLEATSLHTLRRRLAQGDDEPGGPYRGYTARGPSDPGQVADGSWSAG